MTEQSPNTQDERAPAENPTRGSGIGFLPQAVALVGIVAITVIVTLWVSRDSSQPGVEIHIPAPAPVTFQVSGEVMQPGVYSLEGNPRIGDAIDAAGGLTPGADDSRINLALRIRDGAKVVIPAIASVTSAEGPTANNAGESLDTSGGPTGASVISGVGGESAGGIVSGDEITTGLIDLNTATKDQLIALPGIGEVRADSIIEWRNNNLISSANDLLAISGIGSATVDSIRSHVIQP